MTKYIALIIAGLLLIVVLASGYFGILSSSLVAQLIQIIIAFLAGHAVSIGQLHYAAYLEERKELS